MCSLSLGQPYHKDDEYMTPKTAWLSIAEYIPKDKKYK